MKPRYGVRTSVRTAHSNPSFPDALSEAISW